ncbi:MAG: HAD superfamily hydrolase (TIGR01459 family) [Polaribacter sp.]
MLEPPQSARSNSCRICPGLRVIQHQYQAFLIDAWGVLHDGQSLYPHALACLKQLRQNHKKVVIISNAARRESATVRELSKLGIDKNLYHGIASSGELAWHAIQKQYAERNGYYLGPIRSRGLLDGLNVNWVSQIEKADFLLNTGAAQGNPKDASASESLLSIAAELDLPMVCANPDLVAIRGGELGVSAGAIAERYRQLGASYIEYHGKPFDPVYQSALAMLEFPSQQQVLAIGDAFATDIIGASNAGFDSWLIAAGIHRDELVPLNPESVSRAARGTALPNYASEYFQW